MFGEGNYKIGSKGDIVLKSKLMSSKEFLEKMRESEVGKKASGIPVDGKKKTKTKTRRGGWLFVLSG